MRLVSYSETEEVEIDGAKFAVGTIPRGKYRLLVLASSAAWDAARRRVLLSLKAEGIAEPSPEQAKAMLAGDAHLEEELMKHQAAVVAWGIRSHSGILDAAGAEVPFTGTERDYMGRKYSGASDAQVAEYAGSGDLLTALYLACTRKNSLTQDAKKKLAAAAGTDHRRFNCHDCVEAPHLQELNGCKEPLEETTLVQIGRHEFNECPVLHMEPEDLQLVDLVRAGGLAGTPALEQTHLPARLVEGVEFLEALRVELAGEVSDG